MIKLLKSILGIRGSFQELFFEGESTELMGKSKKGILALTLILLLTFLALGFAIGGIDYLKAKMDDPFTNWVNLDIKNSYLEKVPLILQEFEQKSTKDSFQLNNVNEYNIEFYRLVNEENGQSYPHKVRTIDETEILYREILNGRSGNVLAGFSFDSDDQELPEKCGIIIKVDALKGLGYTDVNNIQKIPIEFDEERNIYIYTDVLAVVKELPNLCSAVVTSHFRNLISNSIDHSNFVNLRDKNSMAIIVRDNTKKGYKETIEEIYKEDGLNTIEIEEFNATLNDGGQMFKLYFDNYYSFEEYTAMFNKLKGVPAEYDYIIRYTEWECNVGNYSDIKDPYYLSFNFERLDKVRAFQSYMKEKFKVDISMTQIESKENFALVTRLTSSIALILLGFSILSIIFYINSMLRTHLEKIKTNLGTLKAFGLDNKFLISAYLKIIFVFIFVSIIVALIFCGIFHALQNYIFTNNYFNIFNLKILAVVVLIIVISLFTSYRTIAKTLLKTPGDLIYNR